MGMFSFDCSTCGSHEQFDWTDHVVVALKNVKTDEVVHVLGKYDAYGGVSIDLCEGAPGKYDALGNTPLHLAAFSGHASVVEVLFGTPSVWHDLSADLSSPLVANP